MQVLGRGIVIKHAALQIFLVYIYYVIFTCRAANQFSLFQIKAHIKVINPNGTKHTEIYYFADILKVGKTN